MIRPLLTSARISGSPGHLSASWASLSPRVCVFRSLRCFSLTSGCSLRFQPESLRCYPRVAVSETQLSFTCTGDSHYHRSDRVPHPVGVVGVPAGNPHVPHLPSLRLARWPTADSSKGPMWAKGLPAPFGGSDTTSQKRQRLVVRGSSINLSVN